MAASCTTSELTRHKLSRFSLIINMYCVHHSTLVYKTKVAVRSSTIIVWVELELLCNIHVLFNRGHLRQLLHVQFPWIDAMLHSSVRSDDGVHPPLWTFCYFQASDLDISGYKRKKGGQTEQHDAAWSPTWHFHCDCHFSIAAFRARTSNTGVSFITLQKVPVTTTDWHSSELSDSVV